MRDMNVDTDVNNYTVSDLLIILDLDEVKSDDITEKTDFYINKFNDENDREMASFFQDVQKLYSSLPKDTNPDAAQAAATNLDKLFDINKTVKAAGRASQTDIDNATALGAKVKDSAKEMGLEAEHDDIVNMHIDNIKKHLTSDNDRVSAKADYHPSDYGRFKSPPKEYTPEGPRNDRDVDNVKKYLISRSKAAQRKLKITDGD